MHEPILIRGGLVVDWLPLSVAVADLLVEGGRVVRRGVDLGVSGTGEVDAGGCLVMPGWIVAHHHLYSSLARGMPSPPRAPESFLQILQQVWWVLDRCLDPESIRHSALAGGLEALGCGVTFIVDHHASPNAITGSLDTIAQALRRLGVRASLAYEVSDRDGEAVRHEGIRENRAFTGVDGWSWPFPGGHASFTLSDEAISAFSKDKRIHVHLLEDPCDREMSERLYGQNPVARFDRAGLVGPKSLFAHGVHLTDTEFDLLAERGAYLAYNPRSNANNGVGTRSLDRYAPIGCLGTDGMDSDLWAEIKFAYFKATEAGARDAMGALLSCLQNNYRLASDLSGLALGNLTEGAPADLMLVEHGSATPLDADNFLGHLVFGLSRHHVRDVMVDGAWRLRRRAPTAPKAEEIPARARPVARALWDRMRELWEREGGHGFPDR